MCRNSGRWGVTRGGWWRYTVKPKDKFDNSVEVGSGLPSAVVPSDQSSRKVGPGGVDGTRGDRETH